MAGGYRESGRHRLQQGACLTFLALFGVMTTGVAGSQRARCAPLCPILMAGGIGKAVAIACNRGRALLFWPFLAFFGLVWPCLALCGGHDNGFAGSQRARTGLITCGLPATGG